MNAQKLAKIATLKNITKANAQRSAEFARFVRDAMLDAGISKLCGLELQVTQNQTHGEQYSLGYMVDGYGVRDLTETTISFDGDMYYQFGDFHLPVYYPTRDDVLKLSQDSQMIIDKLAELADKEIHFASKL